MSDETDAIFDEVLGEAGDTIEDVVQKDLSGNPKKVEVSDDLNDIWEEAFETDEVKSDEVSAEELEDFADEQDNPENVELEVDDEMSEAGKDHISEEAEADAPPAKTVKLYNGDEAVELPEDAEIEVKIDGEIHKVKLSDFQSDLSGQKAISQRFSALNAERKAIEERKQALDYAESQVHEMMNSGNVLGALDFMFNAVGYNNDLVMTQFFDQIAEPLQKYMAMSPEEQKAWAAQAQAQRSQLELNKLNEQNQLLQAERAQLEAVRRVQSTVGLDDATFAQRYDELRQEMESGQIAKQPVTADLVGNYHILRERQDWVQGALKNVAPQLAEDVYLINDVLRIVSRNFDAKGANVTQQDIDDIINKAYGAPAKKAKAEKVQEALEKKGNPLAKKIGPAKTQQKALREPNNKQNFLEAMANMSDKELAKAMEKWAK